MTTPRTLLSLAGADPVPAPVSEAALVLIDCQMEYVDGALPLTGVDAALEEVARLLNRFRSAGAPVVHVVHRGNPGGLFDPEGPSGQVAARAAARDGETVVEKTLPNSFAGTTLDATLRGLDRQKLIVAGFMTHMCVSSTVRAGLDLGYASTVAANAAATRDLPQTGGGVIDATTLHNASLAALADRFACIVPGAADLPD
jgi:nicotinamidase-related amidase